MLAPFSGSESHGYSTFRFFHGTCHSKCMLLEVFVLGGACVQWKQPVKHISKNNFYFEKGVFFYFIQDRHVVQAASAAAFRAQGESLRGTLEIHISRWSTCKHFMLKKNIGRPSELGPPSYRWFKYYIEPPSKSEAQIAGHGHWSQDSWDIQNNNAHSKMRFPNYFYMCACGKCFASAYALKFQSHSCGEMKVENQKWIRRKSKCQDVIRKWSTNWNTCVKKETLIFSRSAANAFGMEWHTENESPVPPEQM